MGIAVFRVLPPKIKHIADLFDVSLKKTMFFMAMCPSLSNDVHSLGPSAYKVICRSWMPCCSPMRIAIPRMTRVQRPFNTQRRKEQLRWWHDSCTWGWKLKSMIAEHEFPLRWGKYVPCWFVRSCKGFTRKW